MTGSVFLLKRLRGRTCSDRDTTGTGFPRSDPVKFSDGAPRRHRWRVTGALGILGHDRRGPNQSVCTRAPPEGRVLGSILRSTRERRAVGREGGGSPGGGSRTTVLIGAVLITARVGLVDFRQRWWAGVGVGFEPRSLGQPLNRSCGLYPDAHTGRTHGGPGESGSRGQPWPRRNHWGTPRQSSGTPPSWRG